ncbi:hypothetical protein CALCODRAFT_24292 [Calocera cornea HHB12733]|uniref:Lanthionine synthetase C-like protein n=1 Tax=Calocera cornea HHB12733 TaxID=1353952 RepID=A0A165J1K6_9BASI|nr:hypothetical protein CALCODRAFT_24292 [Calocera cornea HHB12733]
MGRWRAEKLRDALECIWREEIVTKGMGFCHGIAGNVVPFLFQAVWELRQGMVPNEYLGKALALLELSTILPPMPPSTASSPNLPAHSLFRTPDNPHSLFEGMTGAACTSVDISPSCGIWRKGGWWERE